MKLEEDTRPNYIIKECVLQLKGNRTAVNLGRIIKMRLLEIDFWGTQVTQSVKCPTLDFSSGHDVTVHGFEPHVRLCADSAEPAWGSLSPSLSPSLPYSCCLSLSHKINKLKNVFKNLRKRFLVERLTGLWDAGR